MTTDNEPVEGVDYVLATGAYRVMVRHYIEGRLAVLPADGEEHYLGLVDILNDLIARGEAEPEKSIAIAMGVPEETVRARLRQA